jgi:hypothetical protein
MKRRTPKRALLLLITAANMLLGGSWYLDGRLLPRLQDRLQRVSATAKLLLWEKAPQLGDLLGQRRCPGARPPRSCGSKPSSTPSFRNTSGTIPLEEGP